MADKHTQALHAGTMLVGIVLVIAALPALYHLHGVITLIFLAALSTRWLFRHISASIVQHSIRLILIVSVLVFSYITYHGFFNGDAVLSFLVVVAGLKWAESRTRRDALVCIFAMIVLAAVAGLYWQATLSLFYLVALTAGISLCFVSITQSSVSKQLNSLLSHSLIPIALTLPFALILFFSIPRIPGPIWDLGIAFGMPISLDAKPLQSADIVQKRLNLPNVNQIKQSNSVVLVAEFQNNYVPYKSRLYWRGPVFYDFDGTNWILDDQLDADKSLRKGGFRSRAKYDRTIAVKRQPVKYTARVTAHGGHWLYALDLPYGSFPETVISKNLQVVSVRPLRSGEFKYEMGAYLEYEAGLSLDEKTRKRALDTSAFEAPQLKTLSSKITQSYDDVDARLQAVLEFFATSEVQFVDLPDDTVQLNALDTAIFETRAVNELQLSSAFTAIARASGIPTRLVFGYRGGDIIALTDFMIVRNKHAHVWTEVWQPSSGWIRYDLKDILQPPLIPGAKKPSQSQKPKRVSSDVNESTQAQNPTDEPSVESTPTPEEKPGDDSESVSILDKVLHAFQNLSAFMDQWIVQFDPDKQVRLFEDSGFSEVKWNTLLIWSLAAMFLIVALIVAAITFLRRPVPTPLEKKWRRFLRALKPLGVTYSPNQCPTDLQRQIESINPDAAVATASVIDLYTQIRYANEDSKESRKNLDRLISRFVAMT
ncbi:MAG: DUF3488 and transglutaminase-like domain-containing protein [Pseudomonadota bacterium]